MKKQSLNSKLKLSKKVISNLQLNAVKGGHYSLTCGCGFTGGVSADGNTVCASEGSHCFCK